MNETHINPHHNADVKPYVALKPLSKCAKAKSLNFA
jgi:hypothetical protein